MSIRAPYYFYDPLTEGQIRIKGIEVFHIQVFNDGLNFKRIALSIQTIEPSDITFVINTYSKHYEESTAVNFNNAFDEYMKSLKQITTTYFLKKHRLYKDKK